MLGKKVISIEIAKQIKALEALLEEMKKLVYMIEEGEILTEEFTDVFVDKFVEDVYQTEEFFRSDDFRSGLPYLGEEVTDYLKKYCLKRKNK